MKYHVLVTPLFALAVLLPLQGHALPVYQASVKVYSLKPGIYLPFHSQKSPNATVVLELKTEKLQSVLATLLQKGEAQLLQKNTVSAGKNGKWTSSSTLDGTDTRCSISFSPKASTKDRLSFGWSVEFERGPLKNSMSGDPAPLKNALHKTKTLVVYSLGEAGKPAVVVTFNPLHSPRR